jgi:DNA repair protein RadC
MEDENKEFEYQFKFDKSKNTIKDWSDDEKPRERLMARGPSSLTNAELLAILISSGTKGFSALDIAKQLLINNDNKLSLIVSRDYSEFKKFLGLGPARSVTLCAAFELAKRIYDEPVLDKKKVMKPDDVVEHYIAKFRNAMTENFIVVLLNAANQVFREVMVSQGILSSTIVHPREVFRIAIVERASTIILIHNHPSGQKEPSKDDIEITKQLVAAGNNIGIKVMDHIIIAGDTYYSFSRRGLI